MNESDETKNELRKLREKAMQLNFKMEMNESAETRNELNELREKAIQLSIKMKRQAFSNLARDLARFGLSVPRRTSKRPPLVLVLSFVIWMLLLPKLIPERTMSDLSAGLREE
jgi:hypothetical protein